MYIKNMGINPRRTRDIVLADAHRRAENMGGAWANGDSYERWHARKFPRRQGRRSGRTLRSRKIMKKNRRRR